jgi:hypothetical protein
MMDTKICRSRDIISESSIPKSHTQLTKQDSSPLSFLDIGIDEAFTRILPTTTKLTLQLPYRQSSATQGTCVKECTSTDVRDFTVNKIKFEPRGHRNTGSTHLPDVKEEPGFESSADLRQSNFIFPTTKRPESKFIVEGNRALIGVKAIVETLRSFKEHRASFGSASSKSYQDGSKAVKDNRPSTSGNSKTTVSASENVRMKEHRLSTESGGVKYPGEMNRTREHRPSLGSTSIKTTFETSRSAAKDQQSSTVASSSKELPTISVPTETLHSKEIMSFSRPLLESHTLSSPVIGTTSHVFKDNPSNLLQAHAIPSLNFSSINLLSRLSDALDLRRTSMGSDFVEMGIAVAESPQRHSNATIIREKYRSLFLSFDEGNCAEETFSNLVNSPENTEFDEIIQGGEDIEVEERMPVSQCRNSSLRPLSPEELLDEVKRISVPNVFGLTQRLSELLPSLRRHFGDERETVGSEAIDRIEHTLDEIHELGRLEDEQEDKVTELAITWRNSILEKTRSDPHTEGNRPSRPYSVPPPEIADHPSFFQAATGTRLRSLSDSEVDWTLVERINRLARDSNREFRAISPMSNVEISRPWNVAGSYPWSNSIPCFDIQFPTTPSYVSPRTLGGISPSSVLRDSAASDVTVTVEDSSTGIAGPLTSNPTMTGPSLDHAPLPAAVTHRGHSRKSGLLGSFSHRVFQRSGLTSGVALSETSGRRTLLTEATDRVVDPGDRYPTTGLSPPSALNLDDVHSFFSDDSNGSIPQHTQRPRVASFRKRLTSSLRARLPGSYQDSSKSLGKTSSPFALNSRHMEPNTSSSAIHTVPNNAQLCATAEIPAPACISRTEVKTKKLVEKIKTLLWRSGLLLRSMSLRRHRPMADEEHWSETGESLLDLRMPVSVSSEKYDAGRTVMLEHDIGSTRA